MGYLLLLHLSIFAIVIQTRFADEPLFKSFGLANDQPDDPEVDQRSDEAFTIVGLDTSDVQAAKRLEFLKQQIPNPMRSRLRFGSRLRETKQVERITANKQLPPAIRRFFKLAQNKQSMDVTTTATDLSTGSSTESITPIITLATRPTETTFSTATATETDTTSIITTTTADATTTSTTTTRTTATSTATPATPSATTAQATTSSLTTQASTEATNYPASAATTPMMISNSSTYMYSTNSNAIDDTNNNTGSDVPSGAAKGKNRPFSNRVASSKVHSVFEQVKLPEQVPLSHVVQPARSRFVLRVSQASSSSSHSSSSAEASMAPTQEPTIMMSFSSDDSYSDSTAAVTTATDATTSVVSAAYSEASSTNAATTTEALPASSDAGYYESNDATSTVEPAYSSELEESTETVGMSSTEGPTTAAVSSASSDGGYYDSADALSTAEPAYSSEESTETAEAHPIDATTTVAVSSASSDGGYYDSADTSSPLTDTTSTASVATVDMSSTMAASTSSLSTATSSNHKSCKPDSGIRMSAQEGVCVNTMDLGTVCQAMFPTFEAAQSTADCAAFDGHWCCYVPASIASKGRDMDGRKE